LEGDGQVCLQDEKELIVVLLTSKVAFASPTVQQLWMQCGASLIGDCLNAIEFGGALSLHDINFFCQKEAYEWTVVDGCW
jgi:hypothetical protein